MGGLAKALAANPLIGTSNSAGKDSSGVPLYSPAVTIVVGPLWR